MMDKSFNVQLPGKSNNANTPGHPCTGHPFWKTLFYWLYAHQLVAFFFLVFLIAWLVWLLLIASARGWIGVRFPASTLWLAGIAPIGAATLVECVSHGRQGVAKLYSRFLIRRIPPAWYVTAALLPLCIGLVQILVTRGLISRPTVGLALLALLKGILYTPVAAFEEAGWRGFALPRLQKRFIALGSSLLLGCIWAVWHLPLFWLGSFDYSETSFTWWAMDVLAEAALRADYPLPAHRDQVNASQVRFDTFARQARQAAAQGAQVLVTSEMMFNFDPQVEFTEEFRAVAEETGAYIYIGYSVLTEGEPRRNQMVLLSPQGTFSQVYNKTHIPPGEFYDVKGGTFPVFETAFGRMAALICADGNYTDVTRKLTQNGAQLIAAPYLEFPGFGEQLWQNMTFRAVENQTAVVVTGATSVAAIINPYGQMIALDVNKEGSQAVLVGDVSLGSGLGTLYTSLGDILGWAALAGLAGFLVYMTVEARQAKKEARRKSVNETL